jgi:cytochrome c553
MMKAHASQIMQVAVRTHYMPLGNLTGITDDERDQLGSWVAHGASLEGASTAPVPKAEPAAAAAPAANGETPEAEAKRIFAARCVNCHGATGKGDGVLAASLNPKPRDYSDQAWQASVTDDQLRKVILEGGAAVGKSLLMPGNADLKDKPAVLDALVTSVRALGRE